MFCIISFNLFSFHLFNKIFIQDVHFTNNKLYNYSQIPAYFKLIALVHLYEIAKINISFDSNNYLQMSNNPMTEKLRKFRNHKEINTSEFDTSFGECVTKSTSKMGQSSNFHIFHPQQYQKNKFSKDKDKSSKKNNSSTHSRSKTNIKSYREGDGESYSETVDSLTKELKMKDRELQEIIEQIVRREKQHQQQLKCIDYQYEEELNRLHEALLEEVEKNKELQEKVNVVKALGLDTSEDSSMLLADL